MRTLVAAFTESASARKAVDALIEQGFARTSVHLRSERPDRSGRDERGSPGGETPHRAGYLDSIEDAAAKAIDPHDDAPRSVPVGAGADVPVGDDHRVEVDTTSDAEVDRVTALLYDLGATDVDARDVD